MGEIMMLESMDGKMYLMHTGRSKRDGAKVGSGRYPLGSGERPFQGTPQEKRHRMSRAERKAARKSAKEAAKKKTTEEPEEKPLDDEEKKRIIESGDIKAAFKNKKYLTNADIDAVILRHDKEKKLAELMPKKKSGMEYVDKTSANLQSVAKFINSSINVWNASARAINTFTKYNLPTVKDVKDYPNKFAKFLKDKPNDDKSKK